jgi:drug/metabolite transporter (DMT)-like permease
MIHALLSAHYARFCRDVPLLPGITVQFLSATVVCALLTLLFETPHALWTRTAVAGLAWNAGAVSFGGMALYFLMLAHGTAARTTSNFYLVPGVTALMAWLFLGERLSPFAIAGLITTSIGCFLVASRPRNHDDRQFAAIGMGRMPTQRIDPAPSKSGELRDA